MLAAVPSNLDRIHLMTVRDVAKGNEIRCFPVSPPFRFGHQLVTEQAFMTQFGTLLTLSLRRLARRADHGAVCMDLEVRSQVKVLELKKDADRSREW